jgi:CBS domain-containing protein
MGQIRLGNKPPLTVGPQDSIVQAALAMTERQVGAATVVDGTKVLGVVTERDVMQRSSPPAAAPRCVCATSCRAPRSRSV